MSRARVHDRDFLEIGMRLERMKIDSPHVTDAERLWVAVGIWEVLAELQAKRDQRRRVAR